MAETARVIETEDTAYLAPAVDISREITVDVLQTLEEPVSEAILIEGDDSVFYSEDEDIPQEVSVFAPKSVSLGHPWPAQPPSSPQFQNSEAEELVESLSHSIVVMEAGSMHHSGAMLEKKEDFMENEINHVSYLAPVQEMEAQTETASKNSMVHNEKLSKSSKVQCTVSAKAEAAPLPIQDKVQLEEILLAHKMTESPPEPQLEQANETQERDTAQADGSIATTERHKDTEELDESNESSDQPRSVKYGTVSYRRIRRGLARQRIEEFEAMMQL